MKKIIFFFVVFLFCITIHAQEQLNISQAIAIKVACKEEGNLYGYWLDIFGKKVMQQEYASAKISNDEFKLNRVKKALVDKYAEAIKSVKIGPIYYVTELIDNYSYDFSNSSVKIAFGQTNKIDFLDVYSEGGVRRNYMTQGLESDFNPELRISNDDNIPTHFGMPADIAEKSFAQRKGNYKERPAFKLRYYFKFWQCGSKFGRDFGGYACDVEVVKVELIDDIVGYKKAYDVEPGEQPNNAQSKNSEDNNQSQADNKSVDTTQQTNASEGIGNTIYSNDDLEILNGFIDFSRMYKSDKDNFIGEFKYKSILSKSKIRFEQSKEFDNIVIGYYQKGNKQEIPSNYMYYKGILFLRVGNYFEVVRKLDNGIGLKPFTISPPSESNEIYYDK